MAETRTVRFHVDNAVWKRTHCEATVPADMTDQDVKDKFGLLYISGQVYELGSEELDNVYGIDHQFEFEEDK